MDCICFSEYNTSIIYPEDGNKPLVNKGENNNIGTLGQCEGNCNSNDDCIQGLVCSERE